MNDVEKAEKLKYAYELFIVLLVNTYASSRF